MDNYRDDKNQLTGQQTDSGTNAAGEDAFGTQRFYADQGGSREQDVYQAAYQAVQQMPKPKKNKTVPMIMLVLGFLGLLAGIAVIFLAEKGNVLEKGEPVDVYLAEETDQYVYAPVQYLTESVAYYEAMDHLQFYISFDEEWNPAVICIHDDDIAAYRPYIDWLYTEEEENGPEQIQLTGYAQPFDEELKKLVIEGFSDNMGEGYVDEANFQDWFGVYYVQLGQKNSAYGVSNIGIYILVGSLALVIIGGAVLYEKPQMISGASVNGPEVQHTNPLLGILGALLGALVGGLLWTIISIWGYVSGWIGVFIIVFASTGYKILAQKEDFLGKFVSLVFGLLVIIPATYVTYAWSYYTLLNENVSGYTSFFRALTELPVYMDSYELWDYFTQDMVMGYWFIVIAGIVLIINYFTERKKKNK